MEQKCGQFHTALSRTKHTVCISASRVSLSVVRPLFKTRKKSVGSDITDDNEENEEEEMVIPVEPVDQNNETPDSENDEIPDLDPVLSSDDDNEIPDFDEILSSDDDDTEYHPTQHF